MLTLCLKFSLYFLMKNHLNVKACNFFSLDNLVFLMKKKIALTSLIEFKFNFNFMSHFTHFMLWLKPYKLCLPQLSLLSMSSILTHLEWKLAFFLFIYFFDTKPCCSCLDLFHSGQKEGWGWERGWQHRFKLHFWDKACFCSVLYADRVTARPVGRKSHGP